MSSASRIDQSFCFDIEPDSTSLKAPFEPSLQPIRVPKDDPWGPHSRPNGCQGLALSVSDDDARPSK
jgi:hypothetical protein